MYHSVSYQSEEFAHNFDVIIVTVFSYCLNDKIPLLVMMQVVLGVFFEWLWFFCDFLVIYLLNNEQSLMYTDILVADLRTFDLLKTTNLKCFLKSCFGLTD